MGSGKTTLLSVTYHGLSEQGYLEGQPAGKGSGSTGSGSKKPIHKAWLSLDAQDNEQSRFWSHISAAFENMGIPVSAASDGGVADEGQDGSEAQTVNELSNVLYSQAVEGRYIVFVDNIESLAMASLESLLDFIARMVPDNICFVLAGTWLPNTLQWFGLLEDVLEVPASMLMFTKDQAVACFRSQGLLLEQPGEINDCLQLTEGWAMGVQLLAMQRQTHQQLQRQVHAYFQKWVFGSLSHELEQFLLETSLLECLHAPLCDALLQKNNSQSLIEGMLERNLFIKELAGREGWYTVHPMLKQQLQAKALSLRVDYINELNFRTFEWYEHEGDEEQAARHLLMAVDDKMVKHFIEPALRNIDIRHLDITSWLLDRPASDVWANPLYSLFASLAYLICGNPDKALKWLDVFLCNANTDAIQPQDAQLVVECIQVKCASLQGRHKQSIDAIEKLLIEQGDDMPPALKCMCANTLGESYERIGRLEEAQENYLRGEAIGAAASSVFGQYFSAYLYAAEQLLFGRYSHALERSYQALRHCPQDLPIYGAFYCLLARVQIERDRLDEAGLSLRRAFKRISAAINIDLYFEACIVRATLLATEGHLNEAYELLLQTSLLAGRAVVPRGIVQQSHLAQARIALARDSVDEARIVAERIASQVICGDSVVELGLGLIEAQLLLHDDDQEEALALIERIITRARDEKLLYLHTQALLLAVTSRLRAGMGGRSLVGLNEAMSLGVACGFLNVFVDYREYIRIPLQEMIQARKTSAQVSAFAKRLLLAFDSRDAANRHAQAQSECSLCPALQNLTVREREVMRLLANGLSRQEISEVLNITLNTTKTHLNSIFIKLGVHNRNEALALLN
jgi:LuxR family maltose regulon positive regulatory protein